MRERSMKNKKSGQLLRYIGTPVMETPYGDPELWQGKSGKLISIDIYHPSNMYYAWRVHLWALRAKNWIAQDYFDWCASTYIWAKPTFQGESLDKILELLQKAGIARKASS